MERWLELVDFPGYSISDHGKVRNDYSGRILVQQRNQSGVRYVGMVKGGRQLKRSVSKLVAEAYLPRNTDAYFTTPVHIDGDPENNHYTNLSWRSREFADAYHRQFKRGPQIGRPIRMVETGETFGDSWEACMRHVLLDTDILRSVVQGDVVRPIFKHFELAE